MPIDAIGKQLARPRFPGLAGRLWPKRASARGGHGGTAADARRVSCHAPSHESFHRRRRWLLSRCHAERDFRRRADDSSHKGQDFDDYLSALALAITLT